MLVTVLCGCAMDRTASPAIPARAADLGREKSHTEAAAVSTPQADSESYDAYRSLARHRAREIVGGFPERRSGPVGQAQAGSANAPANSVTGSGRAGDEGIHTFAEHTADTLQDEFFKGRYNRSRARLPENIDRWRAEPDIANPGPDLANFPNSAFTLPAGRSYIEISPLTFYGAARAQPVQYNAEYLLRFGVTDDIEARIFGNGVSWQGGDRATWGFAPVAFDTKIQLWTEKRDYYLPAAGFEAYVQTEWLGNEAFNIGTQPSFTFNFDQSLPFEIDFEYNLGAARTQTIGRQNIWEFSFQWGLQRDLFDRNVAVFVHGFYNAMSLPRLPAVVVPVRLPGGDSQNAVGAGFVWTIDRRVALYGQVSAGTTRLTPSTISMLGFAAAF